MTPYLNPYLTPYVLESLLNSLRAYVCTYVLAFLFVFFLGGPRFILPVSHSVSASGSAVAGNGLPTPVSDTYAVPMGRQP